jgi:hypothetical protein
MNKVFRTITIAVTFFAVAILAAPAHAQWKRRQAPAASQAPAPPPAAANAARQARAGKTRNVPQTTAEAGEQFFIISSVDPAKQQLVLKRPTEVTALMQVDDKTTYVDEDGAPLHLMDLRAGDTVYVLSRQNKEPGPIASRIRKGPMTLAELHKHYLSY